MAHTLTIVESIWPMLQNVSKTLGNKEEFEFHVFYLYQIEQLQQKLEGKIEATRIELIEALDASDLDVEEAFYAVQRKQLQSVYVYLTSDYTEVIKMEEKVEGKNEEDKGPVVEDKGPVVDDTEKTGEDKSGKSEMEVMKERVLARVKKEEDKEGFKVHH